MCPYIISFVPFCARARQLCDPPGAALGDAPRPSYGQIGLAAVPYCREDENPSKTDALDSMSNMRIRSCSREGADFDAHCDNSIQFPSGSSIIEICAVVPSVFGADALRAQPGSFERELHSS
jgi:hypothetical protein